MYIQSFVYLYIPHFMYRTSCYPHTDGILPKFPAQQKMLGKPAVDSHYTD